MSTNFYYVANPSRDIRANVLQTFHTSRNLVKLNPNIEIILAKQSEDIHQLFGNIRVYYPVNKQYGEVFANLKKYSRIWNYVEGTITTFVILFHLIKKGVFSRKVVYCREFILCFWLSIFLPLINGQLIYEAHGFETDEPNRAQERWFKPILRFMEKVVMNQPAAIVCISQEFLAIMKDRGYTKLINKNYILPNAFDSECFYPVDKKEALKTLKLNPQNKYIVYSGMTFSYRNLDKFIVEVSRLKIKNLKILLIGGQENEIEKLMLIAKNLKLTSKIKFLGKKSQGEVNLYLGCADCLIIPGVLNQEIASPLKLFEYLAVCRPIVCPDIPAFHNLVTKSSVFYFNNNLASVLTYVLTHKREGQRRAEVSYLLSKKFTFEKRTKKIVSIMNSLA